MPGVSGVTVVTNACAFYTTHAAAGALGARHSLRPLIGGRKLMANLARFRRRDREAALADDSLLLKFASVSHRHCAGCSFDHTLRMTTRPGRSTSPHFSQCLGASGHRISESSFARRTLR